MADSYEINEFNEVVPYTAGRRVSDTNAWREATELELEQRDKILRLESEVERLREKAGE